jgi:hypothetical protein
MYMTVMKLWLKQNVLAGKTAAVTMSVTDFKIVGAAGQIAVLGTASAEQNGKNVSFAVSSVFTAEEAKKIIDVNGNLDVVLTGRIKKVNSLDWFVQSPQQGSLDLSLEGCRVVSVTVSKIKPVVVAVAPPPRPAPANPRTNPGVGVAPPPDDPPPVVTPAVNPLVSPEALSKVYATIPREPNYDKLGDAEAAKAHSDFERDLAGWKQKNDAKGKQVTWVLKLVEANQDKTSDKILALAKSHDGIEVRATFPAQSKDVLLALRTDTMMTVTATIRQVIRKDTNGGLFTFDTLITVQLEDAAYTAGGEWK